MTHCHWPCCLVTHARDSGCTSGNAVGPPRSANNTFFWGEKAQGIVLVTMASSTCHAGQQSGAGQKCQRPETLQSHGHTVGGRKSLSEMGHRLQASLIVLASLTDSSYRLPRDFVQKPQPVAFCWLRSMLPCPCHVPWVTARPSTNGPLLISRFQGMHSVPRRTRRFTRTVLVLDKGRRWLWDRLGVNACVPLFIGANKLSDL